MGSVKNALKKILPPPVNSFMREVNRIVALEEKNHELMNQLIDKMGRQQHQIELQNAAIEYQKKLLKEQQADIMAEFENYKIRISYLENVAKQALVLAEESKEGTKLLLQMEEVQDEMKQKQQEQLQTMTELGKVQQIAISELQKDLEHSQQTQLELLNYMNKTNNEYVKTLDGRATAQLQAIEQLKQQQEVIKTDAKAARNHAWKSQKNSDEILWAEIFHDASSNSTWLNDKAFSAGRWAVGYQYLYAVYRILDEVKPKSILELGLGQSTRLLGQYASANSGVSHMVVEHDPSWIEFFQQDFPLRDNTNIVQLEREYIKFCEDEKVLTFKDFCETFENQKFDFISIDAPFGGEAIVYARVDILNLLPECLAESFVIVVDDYNRHGEKNMVAILEMILSENEISFVKGVYSGQKDCVVICSEDLKFICSM